MSGRFDDSRAAVAHAARRLAAQGLLIGTAGNVSVLVDDHVAVTATGAALAEVTVAEVTVVDRDGSVVAGELEPTSELDLHLGVYASHDATSVVPPTLLPRPRSPASSTSCRASITSSCCSGAPCRSRRTPPSGHRSWRPPSSPP